MDRQMRGEIEEVVARLRNCFHSARNQGDPSLWSFGCDAAKIRRDHRYLEELLSYAKRGKPLSLSSVPDLTESLSKLSKGMTLEVGELLGLKSLILAVEEIADRFSGEKDLPFVQGLALDVVDMPDLLRMLDASFGPDGEVLDGASAKLSSIRGELRALLLKEGKIVEKICRKHRENLEIAQPVLKNGIQALAVSSGKKSQVPGVVIDRSKSGETLFVIPYELLEYESEKERLKGEERSEISHILEVFSKMFLQKLQPLHRNYECYNLLDEYAGKVEYGFTYDGTVAKLAEDALDLKGLIHPLIPLEKAVDNDVSLGGSAPNILVISGPNAGGKSVLMKAVALAAIMNQMGLLVPCHKGAALKVFDGVEILTGDAESLRGNLSSFSGHLAGLKEIYQRADRNSLVLVDEIGQGTSPEDGEAIGRAFVEHVAEMGAFGIFTTHFDGLKKLAVSKEGILSGAMEFSEKTLSPTFRFLPGSVGSSYAFEVARKVGFPEEILSKAKAYRDSQKEYDVERLTAELNRKIKESDALNQELSSRILESKRLEEKRRSAVQALVQERENIQRRAAKKVEEYAYEKIQQLDALWAEGSRGSLPFNRRSSIKGEMKRIASQEGSKEEAFVEQSEERKLSPGDVVSYGGMVGTLVSANKAKAKFHYNGMTMTVDVKDLKKSTLSELPSARSTSSLDEAILHRAKAAVTRLNVIGLTVSEAIPEVDKFLDDAVLSHLSSVTIVHGMGTFALRNGIWEHLKKIRYVKSFREGGEGEGSLGATIVSLK